MVFAENWLKYLEIFRSYSFWVEGPKLAVIDRFC